MRLIFHARGHFFIRLLSVDGVQRRGMLLEIDKNLHVVFLGESINEAQAMLVHTILKVAAHSDIQRAQGLLARM
jgi:hypothetical protein